MEQHLEEALPSSSVSPSPSPSPVKKRGRPKKAHRMSRRGVKMQIGELSSEQASLAKRRRKRKGLLNSTGRRKRKVEREAKASTERAATELQPCRNGEDSPAESVPDMEVDLTSVEAKVGQVVHGVVDGSFDAGFLVTVRVGEADPTVFRGVVFGPGMTIPLTKDKDIAPKARRRIRNKAMEAEPEPDAEAEEEDYLIANAVFDVDRHGHHDDVHVDHGKAGVQTIQTPATSFQQHLSSLVPASALPVCTPMTASPSPFVPAQNEATRVPITAMGFRGPLPPVAPTGYGNPMAFRPSTYTASPLQNATVPSTLMPNPNSNSSPNPSNHGYYYPNASHAVQPANNSQAYYQSRVSPYPYPYPRGEYGVSPQFVTQTRVQSPAMASSGLQVPHT